MWKTLEPGQTVQKGDLVRIKSGTHPIRKNEQSYVVIRSDLHYFEMMPENSGISMLIGSGNKIIRYTDIGYYLFIEVWAEPILDLHPAETLQE